MSYKARRYSHGGSFEQQPKGERDCQIIRAHKIASFKFGNCAGYPRTPSLFTKSDVGSVFIEATTSEFTRWSLATKVKNTDYSQLGSILCRTKHGVPPHTLFSGSSLVEDRANGLAQLQYDLKNATKERAGGTQEGQTVENFEYSKYLHLIFGQGNFGNQERKESRYIKDQSSSPELDRKLFRQLFKIVFIHNRSWRFNLLPPQKPQPLPRIRDLKEKY